MVLWLMCQTGRQDIFILFLTVPDTIWDLVEIVKPKFPKDASFAPITNVIHRVWFENKQTNKRNRPYSEFISNMAENLTV